MTKLTKDDLPSFEELKKLAEELWAEKEKLPPSAKASPETEEKCTHGVFFDEEEAQKILADWQPKDAVDFVMGNPKTAEIRKRWPRLYGECPLKCGFKGIAYASSAHYIYGDW